MTEDFVVEIDMDVCSAEGCEETQGLTPVKTRLVLPMIGEIEVEVPLCGPHLAELTVTDLAGLSMGHACTRCHDTGTVCENHPDRPWAGLADVEECCGGAGMPCPSCCSPVPQDGLHSITEAFVPDAQR